MTTELPSPVPAPKRYETDPDIWMVTAQNWVEWLESWATLLPTRLDEIVTLVSGIDFNGTSGTSIAIGPGSKTFVTQNDKLWQIGQFVLVASAADPANYVSGQITAYNDTPGELTILVPSGGVGGTGTHTDWVISLAPIPANYLSLTGAETPINKTINLANNTLLTTFAQLNAAVTDGNLLQDKSGTQTEVEFAITDAAGFAIDPRNGALQRVTLAANRTPTVANFNNGDVVQLMVAGAGFLLDWSTINVQWMFARPELATYGFTTMLLWKTNSVIYGAQLGQPINRGIRFVGSPTPVKGAGSASSQTPSLDLTGLTGGIDNQVRPGDYVLVGVSVGHSSDLNLSMNTSGYTEIADLSAVNVTTRANLGVYEKFMGATADTTAQASIPANGTGSGYVLEAMVFRGVDPTTPRDVAAVTATSNSSILPDAGSVSPITGDSWVVAIGAAAHSNGAGNFTISDAIYSTNDSYNGTTFDNALSMAVVRKNPIVAVDPAAWTSGVTDSGGCNCSVAIALRAAQP